MFWMCVCEWVDGWDACVRVGGWVMCGWVDGDIWVDGLVTCVWMVDVCG